MPANVVAYWCGLVKLLVCGAHPNVCVCHVVPDNLISTCQRHVWAVPPPNTALELTPLRVERDRPDFESCFGSTAFPIKKGGAAQRQAVVPLRAALRCAIVLQR